MKGNRKGGKGWDGRIGEGINIGKVWENKKDRWKASEKERREEHGDGVRGWRISPRGAWAPPPAAGDSGIMISSSSSLLTSVDEVAISETGMIHVVNDAGKQRRQRLQLR